MTGMIADRAGNNLKGRILGNRSFATGCGLTVLFLGTALISLVWTPYDPVAMDIANRLKPPSAAHWLGTDHFGRDVLAMIMAGARNAALVGIVAVAIGVLVGVLLGLLAAARGGWLEEAVMRIADFAIAFPAILTAVILTAALGPGLVNVMLAIGIANIPAFARLSRGAAKAVLVREFVAAARLAGKGTLRITFEHVLPNISGPLIVLATIEFAIAVLAEAGLSYLGLGTRPPDPSWGRMLAEAQTFLYTTPVLAIWPGIAIAIAVLGLNLLGDGLRDLTDPRAVNRAIAEAGGPR